MDPDRNAPGELVVELSVELAAQSAPEPAGADRRQFERLELGLSAHCQIDGIVSQEALGDLSTGGLYLRTSAQLRVGARVRVVLGLPYIGGQRVCSLAGGIVWIDRGPDGGVRGAGVEFDHETDTADRELLDGFLSLWGTPRPPRSGPGA